MKKHLFEKNIHQILARVSEAMTSSFPPHPPRWCGQIDEAPGIFSSQSRNAVSHLEGQATRVSHSLQLYLEEAKFWKNVAERLGLIAFIPSACTEWRLYPRCDKLRILGLCSQLRSLIGWSFHTGEGKSRRPASGDIIKKGKRLPTEWENTHKS